MKKFLTFILISLLLTSCGKWDNPPTDMPEEQRQAYEEVIEENLAILKDEPENIVANFEVAHKYQVLGDYKKAVKYYEICLDYDANHIVALNNLADIYEDLEEYQLASEYIKRLYEIRPSSAETIKDTVRILLLADDPDNAQLALENYARIAREAGDIDEVTTALISDLYNDIFEYREGQ